MYPVQSDLRSALQIAATFCYLNQIPLSAWPESRIALCRRTKVRAESLRLKLRSRVRAFSSSPSSIESEALVDKTIQPAICTADELHYVSAPNSDWRLALWRYIPSPKAPSRNHPLLLLSGVGTNAIGYDLSPGSSFARYMSSQGFDTWILEVRGAGLSMRGVESKKTDLSSENNVISNPIVSTTKGTINSVLPAEQEPAINLGSLVDFENSAVKENNKESVTVWDESQVVAKLTETFMSLSERVSGFLNEGQSRIMSAKLFDQISKLLEDAQLSERFDEIREKLSGLLEARQNSAIASQIRDLSQRLVNIIEEGQRSVSPQFFDLQERFSTTIEDFQKQLDLIIKYDWDFDNYLEEDVPTAMEYIRAQSKPKDGKLLAIGHSMGGILLYAMLSQSGFEGRDSGLVAVVTLASSLDYTSADPAQALNVPVVPLGALLAAAYPLSCRPPYVLSWLNAQISAEDMMHPELFEKLVLNNFCTIPAKLVLQLTTAFKEGGLRNRDGTFFFKDHLHKSNIPVLAFAGDQDLICPPEAVYETVKVIPRHLVTYKILGQPGGPHYAHYDLVGGRLAVEQVYPCIIEFLTRHDVT
uniref:AB hydrolase-1 domain-containing protein n=1 Tax=Nelumbo nucifera TaxID=4432 RepID=A0A822YID7_NELNU|nr:TPA_asm: hypothetical protein HUJ06_010734 [Nelumbo nucifera]